MTCSELDGFEGIQDNDLLKLKEACKAFNLDGVLLSSLVLSRLYGVCYVLLGTVDGGNLDQPFDLNKLGVGRLEFFTVLKKSTLKLIPVNIYHQRRQVEF